MNPPKEVGLMRKFVSTARSIITKQVEMPLGILRLTKNLAWLEHHRVNSLTSEELMIIDAYYNRIKELPLGQERIYWAPELLRKSDGRLARITSNYQEKLMSILLRIVVEAA